MIDVFIRSRRVVLDRDAETLGHACAGPGAQMRAAAVTHSLVLLPEAERAALDSVQALAERLREKVVVWDLATRGGRKEAKRRGIRETPRVVFGSWGPVSVDIFRDRMEAVPRERPVPPR